MAAPRNVARKLLESHLVSGKLDPGSEIAIRIDQTLTQGATGTAGARVLPFRSNVEQISQFAFEPITNQTRGAAIHVTHDLSPREVEIVLAGGLIPLMRGRLGDAA